jgi:type I restriction enzyme S subunit
MTDTAKSARKSWTKVAFGDVVQLARERSSDPEADGHERFIGLEHIDPGDLRVRRWGNIADGVTFTNVFKPGQVLYGKRRAYQRKVAVADFGGVCSSDIYVLEPKGEGLLPELLPFICQTDAFFEHAVGTSAGSLSPRTNWDSLASFEFALPPIEEQRRLVGLLAACQHTVDALLDAGDIAWQTLMAYEHSIFEHLGASDQDLSRLVEPGGLVRGPFGGSLKKEIFRPSGYAVYEQAHAICGDFSSVRYFIDESKFASMARFQLRTGDLIMSCSGTIGKIAIVPEGIAKGVINQALLKIRPDLHKVRPQFLAAYLRSSRFSKEVARLSMGSAMANVASIRLLEKLPCPAPDLSSQDQIVAALSLQRQTRDQLNTRAAQVRDMQRRLIKVVEI